MASVTQCDVCKNVCKHEESMDVEINSVTQANKINNTKHHLEICPECYKKLCKLFSLEEKK